MRLLPRSSSLFFAFLILVCADSQRLAYSQTAPSPHDENPALTDELLRVPFPSEGKRPGKTVSPAAALSTSNSWKIQLTFDQSSGQLVVTGMEESKHYPPKNRNPSLRDADYIFQGEDADGNILGNFEVPNPNLMYHDDLQPQLGDPGHLEGGAFLIDQSTFEVLIPYVPNLAKVKLLKIERNDEGTPTAIGTMGASSVKSPNKISAPSVTIKTNLIKGTQP